MKAGSRAVCSAVRTLVGFGWDKCELGSAGAAYSRYGTGPVGAILGAEFSGNNPDSSANVAGMTGWSEIAPSIVLPDIVEMINDQGGGVMRGLSFPDSSAGLPIYQSSAVMAGMRPEPNISKQNGSVFEEASIFVRQWMAMASQQFSVFVPVIHISIIAHARTGVK